MVSTVVGDRSVLKVFVLGLLRRHCEPRFEAVPRPNFAFAMALSDADVQKQVRAGLGVAQPQYRPEGCVDVCCSRAGSSVARVERGSPSVRDTLPRVVCAGMVRRPRAEGRAQHLT